MNIWIYLGSAGMSALGNSIAGIVWPWIVLERTGDPAAAGLVAAAVAVPSVIFASLGGYLIDTVGRKPMSVISDIISGASVAGVAFLVGPAVAGVLLAALNSSLVLIITAACSFLAALLTTFLRLAKRELTEEEKQATAADNALNLQALKSWDRLSVPHPFGCLAFSFYAIGMMISRAGIAKVGTSRRRLVRAVAIGVEAIGFAMMAALGVSWLVVIGCGIAGLAGGMLSPLQMVLITLSIYQLAVLLVAAYMLVAVWAMIRGLKVLPSFVASEATTTPVDTISGQGSPEGETSS
ncbi:MFS transporter [Corynebacterium stationis]|uniref:MFS transporter n=1 Tax=Corynebacterium stationis TaxID=1705 RepID=UPI002611C3F1|nr:MFS transporter [Corynebacterium stationis]